MRNLINKRQNKGEWCEAHVKLSLLSKSPINVIDLENENTKPYVLDKLIFDNKFYTTIGQSVYIKETNSYTLESSNSFLVYVSEIKEKLPLIEKKMKGSVGVFEIEEAEMLAKKLKLETACTPGNKKSDLSASFREGVDGNLLPLKEVSVKAFIGSNPTVLNASINGTKLKIKLGKVSELIEKELLALKQMNYGARKTLRLLSDMGFNFNDAQFSEVMEYNLNIFGAKKHLLNSIMYYFTKTNRTRSTMETICEDAVVAKDKNEFIAGIKKLLRYSVTGMNPSEKLDLAKKQTDLMLLVNNDFSHDILSGEKTLEHYLYQSCYIDVPSQSRHNYGFIYKDSEDWFIDLNFQIRMQPITKDVNE